MLSKEHYIQVVGQAVDGLDAIAKANGLHPDKTSNLSPDLTGTGRHDNWQYCGSGLWAPDSSRLTLLEA